jgi:tetratricopeptide (TPR) repeat protein
VHLADEAAQLAALKKLLPGSTPDAIRGFIQATQDIAGPTAGLKSAAELLAEISQEVQGRAPRDEQAADEVKRLSIEIANQGGRVFRRQGDLKPAIALLQDTVEFARSLKDERLLGVCTTNLCRAQLDAAQHGHPINRQAIIRTLEDNVARLERCGDKRNLAVAWNNLGDAYAPIDGAQAERCLRNDLQLAEEFAEQCNDMESLVGALDRLGVHLSGQNRPREAIEIHSRERQLFSRLFDFEREAQCLANLGRAYLGLAIQDPEAREAALQEAIQILSDSRRRYGNLKRSPPLGPVLENLGKCHWMAGDTSLAVATLQEAIREYQHWPQHAADARRLQDDLSRAGF